MNSNSKVLALKYRPQNFDQLIGQKVIAESIFNSIKLNKIPNAYMFLGIRGSGKTSAARIVAKALNCKNGVENLCIKNYCESCQSIIDGNNIDIEFKIFEGPKIQIERVNIFGNTVTSDTVIRSELLLDEGDPYSKLKLSKSISELKARNIFKKVQEKIVNGSKKDLKILTN